MTVYRSILPAPFTIAIVLSVVTYILALIFTPSPPDSEISYPMLLLTYWEAGLWENSLLVFAIQMMLMLVLGHVLALTEPVSKFISHVVKYCTNTGRAAGIVTFLAVFVSMFNWGLGLIFGAILARKVAEHASENGLLINYPIIGAAGYSGLMVWHGGLSGSSLTKIAEPGHIKKLMEDTMNPQQYLNLPDRVSFSETVFSGMNITVMLALFIILPVGMYLLGKKAVGKKQFLSKAILTEKIDESQLVGAEKLDHSKFLSILFGGLVIGFVLYKIIVPLHGNILAYFTPNNINFLLLGLGVLFHGSILKFLNAVDNAILGASGILIQFPIYFGIMGIMKNSGLVTELSEFFVSISNPTTYPLLTFISAGIVNVFVPSGGGQWAVQGPIIVQAATDLGISLPKSILAMAYGDQLTNMLQPFWALPLLGITGLKAKDILPYTLYLLLLGLVVFIAALLLF